MRGYEKFCKYDVVANENNEVIATKTAAQVLDEIRRVRRSFNKGQAIDAALDTLERWAGLTLVRQDNGERVPMVDVYQGREIARFYEDEEAKKKFEKRRAKRLTNAA